MGGTHPGCGLQTATTLEQLSPAASETMVGLVFLQFQVWVSCSFGSATAGLCCCLAAAESIGVCAEPELAIRNLTPANPFFLIGSDGIFEFMPSQTVVDMVRRMLQLVCL